MIQIFKGKDIGYDEIKILKNIAFKRYSQEIYEEYFSNIKDIKDLAYLHDTNVDMENLVIGTNWFLCYSESDYYITILEWISLNDGNKFMQAIEMMSVLKEIFLQNKDKLFIADMRHDTSYPFYLSMVQKGYLKEIRNECIIDCAAPRIVNDLIQELSSDFSSIEDFLVSSESNDYTEYFKYILHHLSFVVTNKFLKKYEEPQIQKKKRK